MSDNPKILPLHENPDPMGRPAYQKEDGDIFIIAPPNDDHLLVGDLHSSWNYNYIQFARLISEICAEGITESLWDGILNQMGLESDQLSSLLDRAQDVFERDKLIMFGHAHQRWVVQHEFDTDPTYIVDSVNDPEGDNAICLPAGLPWQMRRVVAQNIALMLNTDGRYCHPEAKGLYEITDAIKPEPKHEPEN